MRAIMPDTWNRPLERDPAILCKEPSQGIDRLRALSHQQVASTEHGRAGLLLLLSIATKRILGRWAASQIASASAASFFCRFTNGFT
jgi:hypothetical protein